MTIEVQIARTPQHAMENVDPISRTLRNAIKIGGQIARTPQNAMEIVYPISRTGAHAQAGHQHL